MSSMRKKIMSSTNRNAILVERDMVKMDYVSVRSATRT